MMYYEGNAEDVTVVAHVTEHLTGNSDFIYKFQH